MDNPGTYTILIVDDNHNNLFTLKTLIEQYIDGNVIEADCGEEALKVVLRNQVDLIILDVHMDGMNGFEIASIIKQRRKTADIPIVFLTASCTGDEFRRRGYEIGAVDYLTKPIDEYQLINRINVYLKLIEKERSLNIYLEQKVSEKTKELKAAKEAAEAANEEKTVFLANISHELRTPLNILLSTTQLMKMYLNDDVEMDKSKFKQKVDIQVQNCYRLLRLVNNLIDITKMDAGFFTLNPSICNIIEVVEDITMSVADYIHDKGIGLIFDTDIEEREIECDPNAIERIMLNLFSNAVKFTPLGGSIFVNIKNTDQTVRISVKDTGAGIKDDKLGVIFERFKQADELYTRQAEGSGIGLSLVKSLVELHGGSIGVKSEYQNGSEFIVELPANRKWDRADDNIQLKSNLDSMVQKVKIEFSDIYL